LFVIEIVIEIVISSLNVIEIVIEIVISSFIVIFSWLSFLEKDFKK